MTSDRDRPQLAGVHHLGVSVTNLERSIRFYCDVLGADLWREPYDGDRSSFSGRMALVSLGGLGLDLFEHRRNEGDGFDAARTGLDHFALGTQSVEELQGWANWLDACAVPHTRRSGRWTATSGRCFDFVDPDGIQLEFIFVDQAKLL